MKITWILIANACQARLFKAEKSYRSMTLIGEFFHPECREKIVDLVINNRGRYRDVGNASSGYYEERTNPREVEAGRFAHKLAQQLNKGRNENLYANLILIAPSHFQGLLNKCFNPHVKQLIITTIDKDYTHIKERQLFKYLDGKVSIPLVHAA